MSLKLSREHPLYQFKYCPKCGSTAFVENNFKSKHCLTCNFTYYFNPSTATVAVIVNESKEILVATRAFDPAKGTYDLPGGFVDMDETPEEAIRREVYEETNLKVLDSTYLFSVPNNYIYSEFEVKTTDLFFLCKVASGATFTAHDDVAMLQFIPIKDLDPNLFGLSSVRKGIEKIQLMNL